MKRLIQEGKSIILITHKLKEIMEVSDRVTVIRKGEGIGTVITAETNPNELASLMVGRQVDFYNGERSKRILPKMSLVVKNLVVTIIVVLKKLKA